MKNAAGTVDTSEWDVFMKLWSAFCSSSNQADYDSNLEAVTRFSKKHKFYDYLQNTWLKLSHKFVALFTSTQLHFGNSTTSRVEGAHKHIKLFIFGGNQDFLSCFNSVSHALQHQISEYVDHKGIDKNKTLSKLPKEFHLLPRKITRYAILKVQEQYLLMPNCETRLCTGGFRGSWGMPCAHELSRIVSSGTLVSPDLFHDQWKLGLDLSCATYDDIQSTMKRKIEVLSNLPEHQLRKLHGEIEMLESNQYALVMITNPEVRTNTRGRPKLDSQKKISQNSTSRIRSDFEILDEQNKRGYSCSKCRQRGHRANQCTPALAEAAARYPMPELPQTQRSKTRATRAPPKCSKCKRVGHRSNRCAQIPELTAEELALDNESETGEGVISSHLQINSTVTSDSVKTDVMDQEQTEGLVVDSTVDTLLAKSDDHLPDPEDSFERVCRGIWGGDDEIRCPLCDEPLPKNPSEKFNEMLRFQLAKPHANKRPLPGNPDAVYLPVSNHPIFCYVFIFLTLPLCLFSSSISKEPQHVNSTNGSAL